MQDIVSQHDTAEAMSLSSKKSEAPSLPRNIPQRPFDTLPVEVTSIIFVYIVHSFRDHETSPLTLGKICRQWRQIAWSTPQLWTKLSMHSGHTKWEPSVRLAEEWLSRSGRPPLTINLSADLDSKLQGLWDTEHKIDQEALEICRLSAQ